MMDNDFHTIEHYIRMALEEPQSPMSPDCRRELLDACESLSERLAKLETRARS